MTNYAQLNREFNTLRDLRRSALLQMLEAQEQVESTSLTTELPTETPDTKRAEKYYTILDTAIKEMRNLMIEQFKVTDLTSVYDL